MCGWNEELVMILSKEVTDLMCFSVWLWFLSWEMYVKSKMELEEAVAVIS